MDTFRQAKCTACAATFKVPGTFAANKAKCPKCGGVVEIGPVQSAAPKAEAPKQEAPKAESAAPAAKPVPAAVPPPKPAAPKAAPAPAPKPAAPAPKPAAAPAKPAAAAKPAAPSVRDAAASAASKVKSGATTPAASKAKKGAAEEGEAEGKRSRHVHKEKSKAPMILGALFCVAMVGAAGWWFGVKLPAEEKAKEEAAAALAKQKREAADAQAAKDKAEMEAADAARLAAAAAADQQKGGDAPAASSANGEKPAEKPVTPKAPDSNVVDDIDLTAFPELPKQSSCSDEQWASLQDDARTLIDPAAGAKGGRAGKRLQEAGRLAVPALLNQFRTINPATDDGRKAGDLIQKTLERICNGRNFGWQYTTEPKDVVYNKKAIKNWFKIWETVGEDEQQWLGFTKQLQKEGDAAKPAEGDGKAASGLDDF